MARPPLTIALKRLNRMYMPGGQIYIHNVVIEEVNAIENIAAFIDKLATARGKLQRWDTERHYKDEYSTYDWVVDGLFTRSVF